jgi:DNA-binding NtrC family response regulator
VKPRILVLDDESRMVDIIGMVLRREGYEIETRTHPRDALAALEADPYDLLLTDLKMPDMDGVALLRRAREIQPELPVILITAHATVSTAIDAIRAGAFDYVEKPFDNTELKTLVARALEVTRLSRENRYLRSELAGQHPLESIVAESEALREVLERVRRAARSPSTLLVTGESGTGKELIARAVHYHSDRVASPFVAVNCKALASGVLESELFGHEQGAFTGADRSREGIFERASGGTVFLDELGEIDAEFQAKLLRVLQERVVVRVGGATERSVDVRIVAATNRDLRAEVAEGRFREDLYFRLAVIPIHLPPLRERREDVLPLARHFLARLSEKLERPIEGWEPEVEERLLTHPWPGNARELENAIERGVVLATGSRLVLDDLLLDEATQGEAPTSGGLQGFLDQAARERVQAALRDAGGKRIEAARALGIDRTTLYRLMRKHGIQDD